MQEKEIVGYLGPEPEAARTNTLSAHWTHPGVETQLIQRPHTIRTREPVTEMNPNRYVPLKHLQSNNYNETLPYEFNAWFITCFVAVIGLACLMFKPTAVIGFINTSAYVFMAALVGITFVFCSCTLVDMFKENIVRWWRSR